MSGFFFFVYCFVSSVWKTLLRLFLIHSCLHTLSKHCTGDRDANLRCHWIESLFARERMKSLIKTPVPSWLKQWSLFDFLCQKHHFTLSSYLVFAGAPQSSMLSTMLMSRYFWSFLPLFLLFFFVLSSNSLHFLSSVPCLSSSLRRWILLYESARPALGFSTFPRTPAPPI